MGTKLKNFENVEDYFNQVDVYSKVVRNNYMFHNEIFSEFKSFLGKNYKDNSFKLLEIGCGDGFFMSQVLKDTNISSYTAYDISDKSIEEAKKNLSTLKCKKQFINFDISRDFLDSEIVEKYDLIWSSYTLHHLPIEDKRRFFQTCFKNLKENSYLILVDFINDYSSRDDCLKHYRENVEKKWTNLTKEEKEYLYEHVFKFDFPESIAIHKDIAKDAGFKKSEKVFHNDSWAYMVFAS